MYIPGTCIGMYSTCARHCMDIFIPPHQCIKWETMTIVVNYFGWSTDLSAYNDIYRFVEQTTSSKIKFLM